MPFEETKLTWSKDSLDKDIKIVKQKPRSLQELQDNPFPIFPHEIHENGPLVDTCKYCKLHKTGIQKYSLACTLEREKLRVGGW